MGIPASHRTLEDAQIEAQILTALAGRDAHSSCCPSEVASALTSEAGEAWRALMPRVRRIAAKLALEQRVRVTRGTETIAGADLTGGPIRIRRGPRFDEQPKLPDAGAV